MKCGNNRGTGNNHEEYDHDGMTRHQLPRLSIFYGEQWKGEINIQTWKYERDYLVVENKYTEDTILMAIRRSAKSEVANI